jgi:hypothetical protein
VELIKNMDNSKKGTLSFCINKTDYGIAYTDCKGKMKIAVCYICDLKGKFK